MMNGFFVVGPYLARIISYSSQTRLFALSGLRNPQVVKLKLVFIQYIFGTD
jgi:hypothetical protein|tara:strand:- start:618 stop:770 length:153 start_codon:yes stop_codon:yes gene_type:complete